MRKVTHGRGNHVLHWATSSILLVSRRKTGVNDSVCSDAALCTFVSLSLVSGEPPTSLWQKSRDEEMKNKYKKSN